MAEYELLERLCTARGVSGQEGEIRRLIQGEIEPFVDESTVDALGNLIVLKKGKERAKIKLMLSAHMDEVGFLVTHITAEGYLKIAPVGGIDQRVAPGREVLIGKNQVPGVIGIKPIHLSKDEERERVPSFDQLFVDIGVSSREDAQQFVSLGEMATFSSVFDSADGMIKSKAIDDRAGCAILIELLKRELPYDLFVTFVVQEEVGLRGAKTAAFQVAPDAAIVVEATTAADVAGVDEEKQVCKVGEGAVVSFMDRSTIYDREYFQLALDCAQKAGVKAQVKQAVAGGNDAGAIQVSGSGVRTVAVSLPCRYLHSAVGLISQQDYHSVLETVWELSQEIASRPVR